MGFAVVKKLRNLFLGRLSLGPLKLNVQLDLTNACNLRCTHCYHPDHVNSGTLKTEEWIAVIHKIKQLCQKWGATPLFLLCGGEPTRSAAFGAVLRQIRADWPTDEQAEIGILTNGTLLDKPLSCGGTPLELIREANAFVQVSLDGAGEDTHDAIRGKGNFGRTIEGVRSLRKAGVPVSLQAVLKRSLVPEIEGLFHLAKKLDVASMNFVRLVSRDHLAIELKNENLMGRELEAAMRTVLAHSLATQVATNTRGALWALIAPSLGSAERLGFYDVIVDHQGYLKVSSRTPERIGHVLHDSIEDILLHSPVLKRLRVGEIEGCRSCKLFQTKKCSGDRNIAFAMQGSYLAPDVGCWKWREENYEGAKTIKWDYWNQTPLSKCLNYRDFAAACSPYLQSEGASYEFRIG